MSRMIKEMVFQDCPIRNVLARISDKWSLLVIYTLNVHKEEPLRFNALRKLIPDISQKMLTSTLKTLETDGYVNRKVYAEVPPRVEYSLTSRAESLIPIMNDLIGWASDNMAAILKDRTKAVQGFCRFKIFCLAYRIFAFLNTLTSPFLTQYKQKSGAIREDSSTFFVYIELNSRTTTTQHLLKTLNSKGSK